MTNSTEEIIDLNKIKEFLLKQNISNKDFAKAINLNYSTVTRIFNGKRNPGKKFIAGLLQSGLLPCNQIFKTNIHNKYK